MLGTVGFFIGIFVALLAIVVKLRPYWLLHIPKVGFIFHTVLTGEPVPAYIRNDCYKGDEFLTWAQPGDAIVSTLAKAGTTWMLYVSHLIRIRGRDDLIPYHEVNTNSPWTQLVHKPGQTWADQRYLLYNTVLSDGTNLTSKWNHPDYVFRVWKSHEAPMDTESLFHNVNAGAAVLPVRQNPKIKFLAMVRDIPDVMASFYPFSKSHVASFRTMWGGFPPDFSSKREMIDLVFGGGMNQDVTKKVGYAFLEYCRLWWKWRNEPNVLLLHFNDALRDPNGTIAKLATFYGVDLTQEEIESITAKTSFEAMKKMKGKFNYQLWANKEYMGGDGVVMEEGKMFNKGKAGGSKSFFTDEEMTEIRGYMKGYITDPVLYKWIVEGGEV